MSGGSVHGPGIDAVLGAYDESRFNLFIWNSADKFISRILFEKPLRVGSLASAP